MKESARKNSYSLVENEDREAKNPGKNMLEMETVTWEDTELMKGTDRNMGGHSMGAGGTPR